MQLIVCIFVIFCIFQIFCTKIFQTPNNRENDPTFWEEVGRSEIKEALNRPVMNGVAKNVILFLGDGMGITVTTVGRILKGQRKGHSGEEGSLVWDRFPNVALAKTYNLDRQVPDSAATASAFLTGVKSNFYTVGLTGTVKKDDCEGSLLQGNRVSSIATWAQEAGKDTGVVTTTQITHATPAALYGHSANRMWQCDGAMLQNPAAKRCKDLARQLVEDSPGNRLNVIMGGGRQEMGVPGDPNAPNKCLRQDKVNLVNKWQVEKQTKGNTTAFVTSLPELNQINLVETDYIMGLFSDGHLPYTTDTISGAVDSPSLTQMTKAAITRLSRSKNGFFLLVEGGRIDHALHDTTPRRALDDLLEFEGAVKTALEMIDLNETLLIVTADHSHVMTFNGYPERGMDILGLLEVNITEGLLDNLPYPTLMFTNGPGYNFSFNGKKVVRRNLTGVDTSDPNFVSPALVPIETGYETHGGEDVAIYATGPMSHLFHRVHEQSYIAHVMSYASCVGSYSDCVRSAAAPNFKPNRSSRDSSATSMASSAVASVIGLLTIALIVFKY